MNQATTDLLCGPAGAESKIQHTAKIARMVACFHNLQQLSGTDETRLGVVGKQPHRNDRHARELGIAQAGHKKSVTDDLNLGHCAHCPGSETSTTSID